MFQKTLFGLAFALVPSIAFGAYDESRCRSVDSNLTAPAWGRGAATGYTNDYIILTDCNGTQISCRTVQYWINQVGHTDRVYETERHSDGQVSVRFNYWAFSDDFPALPGGTVEVRRGSPSGELIDRDRLTP